MNYLLNHLHEPIFYPSPLLWDHEIVTYAWSPTQQSSHTTFGSIVLYSDSAFANILPHRLLMQYHIATLNGVAIDWTSNIQTKIAADSTDAEVITLYSTCHKVITYQHFFASGQYTSDLIKPIVIFSDNEAAVGLMKSNKLITLTMRMFPSLFATKITSSVHINYTTYPLNWMQLILPQINYRSNLTSSLEFSPRPPILFLFYYLTWYIFDHHLTSIQHYRYR